MFPTTHWLEFQRDALIDWVSRAQVPAGFGFLDDKGLIMPELGSNLWITARFTHVMACEVIRGNSDAASMLDHGVVSLLDTFQDPSGGWYNTLEITSTPHNPQPLGTQVREGFAHAYIALAAASALKAQHPRAKELFDRVQALLADRFIDPDTGLLYVSKSWDWSTTDSYYSTGPSLHLVESSLAAFDATGDKAYLERALRVGEFVLPLVKQCKFHVPEHLNSDWEYDDSYHRDCPKDPARPWGAQVGHGCEWARLLLQTAIMAHRHGLIDPYSPSHAHWFEYSFQLFRNSVTEGWDNGFAFTTDFDGNQILVDRHWWTLTEALCAAHAFSSFAKDYADSSVVQSAQEYFDELPALAQHWWAWADAYHIAAPGQWHHELDPHNEPIHVAWQGKPEPYHSYQALVYPLSHDYALSFAGGSAPTTL
ncbi:MAG: AGE family epimerase/isomerase [Corynebacterium sp.]|nr:AGE family epimerase/isomerase [Corynebacterium sp.]